MVCIHKTVQYPPAVGAPALAPEGQPGGGSRCHYLPRGLSAHGAVCTAAIITTDGKPDVPSAICRGRKRCVSGWQYQTEAFHLGWYLEERFVRQM